MTKRMDDNYILLYEAILERTFEDYAYLCKGKMPPCFHHAERVEHKELLIKLEKQQIENMVYNGICDYLFIDSDIFQQRLKVF